MSLEAGRKLGHYEILEPIGKGGMGEVYRATDAKLGRDVAIKVLPEAFAEDEERRKRFQREAKVLASLNHPNIAAIYGLEQSKGTHYLVLELVPGQTLAERIARGPIPFDEAVEIAVKIAEALEDAHAHGIVHRDLKPANIKLTPDGKIKVLDFGLAKAFAEEVADVDSSLSPTITRDATRMGVILGTAAYMSPEQAKGKVVDKRTDIFAFGAVLFEMLTAKKAFPGEDVSEVLASVIKLEPDWSALPADLPQSVRGLLGRCLAKDARRRFHDIADARLELVEPRHDPSPPVVSVAAWSTRNALAAALAIAAAAFATGWLWPKTTPPSEIERFVVPLDETLNFRFAATALSPDGSELVFSADNLQESRFLYRRTRGELEPVPIAGTEDGYDPFFSPDGNWLGFFTSDGKLKKLRWPPQGAPVEVCEAGSGFGVSGSWGPDGTIVFSNGRELYRVSAAGGTPTPVTSREGPGEAYHTWPHHLPDGRSVLFTLARQGTLQAAIASLETGEWVVLGDGGQAQYASTGHVVFESTGDLWARPYDLDQGSFAGDAVQVASDVGAFSVGHDGTLVYTDGILSGQSTSLVWVDRNGDTTPALNESGTFQRPRLSPDGRLLAVEIVEDGADDDLWVYDLARGTRTRLTFDEPNTDPVWTPDGQFLAHSRGFGYDENIMLRRSDGSGEMEALVSREASQNPHSWSPDGRVLAFYERVGEASRDIWTLSLDGDREPQPFLVTEFNERSPSFSPDGRFIAYTSDESGEDQIYIQAYPGPGGKIPVSRTGGREPVWSRDGRELFFRNGGQVWAAAIDTGTSLEVGEPTLLIEGPYLGGTGAQGSQTYDVAPDGQRFLMLRADESPSGRMVVVLNWTEELKRLVPTQ